MPTEIQEFDLIDPTQDDPTKNFPEPKGEQAQQQNAAGEEEELQIVDDTPEEDRNRPPVAKSDDPLEPTQEELQRFSERDRSTLAKLRQARHDERRRADAAERERQAAIEYARALQQQVNAIQNRYATDANAAVKQLVDATEGEISYIKAQLSKAYEAGDANQVTDLTEKLTDAKAKLWQYKNYQPQVPQIPAQGTGQAPQAAVQSAPSEVPQVTPDARALEWQRRNDWFLKDPVMTNAAFGIHEKLVRMDRLDPNIEPDEYYERLDAELRQLFPKLAQQQPAQQQQAPQQRSGAPVAGVNRASGQVSQRGGKTVVQLTKSQLAIAESLGIPPKEYAKELLRINKEQR